MLNKQAIYVALMKQPLCHGALIRQVGMTHEVCAIGALILDVGGNVNELHKFSENELYNIYAPQLRTKFGIDSWTELSRFMSVNDAEEFVTRRTKKVLTEVVGLTDADIDGIMGKVDSVNATNT